MSHKRETLRARAAARMQKISAYKFNVITGAVAGLLVLVVGIGIGANTQAWNGGLRVFGIKPDVPAIDLSSVEETYEKLAANYDGKLDTAKLVDGANHGLVAAVGDPYTVYFSAKEATEFTSGLEGSFSGIGAELTLKDSIVTVVSTLDGSPSRAAGVKAGDRIVGVNDTSTQGWSIDKAISEIRGEAGTTVKLSIVRGDSPVELSVTRAALTDPSVRSEVTDGIGYIRISRFGETDTVKLARGAARSFKEQDVKGVVLDLRGNGGGYVDAARDIASIWLNDKPIVSEKTGGETVRSIRSANNAILADVPTIILMDGGSASASEIVAGALKDNGAATLYGEKSFGKGVVQGVLDLSNGAELKVTTASWYTPKGRNINKAGIEPDVKITPTQEQIDAGEDPVRSAAAAKLAG